MNIKLCRYTDTKTVSEFTQKKRDEGMDDVYVYSKKDGAPVGFEVSPTFPDEYLNHEYIAAQGIQQERGTDAYGMFGNALSVPGVSLMVVIPMRTKEYFSIEYVEAAFERMYGCEKPKEGMNDFMKNGKKVIGRAVFGSGTLYHGIACINDVPKEMDNIFSEKWSQTGKALPSERVMSYREALSLPSATIEDFTRDLKFRMNEQLKDTIQDIVILDLDEGGVAVGRL